MTQRRILLVEDEQVVRDRLTELLSKDRHTVVHANNGAEGFALFKNGRFDLVITNYHIPFVKGNELASQIKELIPSQPVLMISPVWHRPGPENPVDAALHAACDTGRLRQVIQELFSKLPGDVTA